MIGDMYAIFQFKNKKLLANGIIIKGKIPVALWSFNKKKETGEFTKGNGSRCKWKMSSVCDMHGASQIYFVRFGWILVCFWVQTSAHSGPVSKLRKSRSFIQFFLMQRHHRVNKNRILNMQYYGTTISTELFTDSNW